MVISFEHQDMARRTFIRLQLRKCSCVRVEIFAVSIPSIHLWNKKNRISIIFIRSWVLVYIAFAHGRTDGRTGGRTDIFRKSFLFSSWSRIYVYTCLYLSRLFFKFPVLTKVSIPFLLWKWVWKLDSLDFYWPGLLGVQSRQPIYKNLLSVFYRFMLAATSIFCLYIDCLSFIIYIIYREKRV